MANYYVLPYETPILSSHYSLGEKLAEGDYGATYLCHDKSTGEEFACKSISKTNGPSNDGVLREIEIMHRVSKVPSVVAFRDAYEDSEHVHLVTEHCDGGGLFTRILRNGSYCERDVVKLMKTVVEFVESCHSLGVMHRDLKPQNLLFKKSKDHNSPLKVSGFGLAVFFRRGDTFTDTVGSPYYVAPEVLNNKYGPEADVWSVGIILYILLSGVPPFWAETKEDVYHEILKGTLDLESQQWSEISDNAKDLLRKMLTKEPEKRLSAYYVLGHPWMTDESNVPDRPLDSAHLRLKQFLEMNELN